MKVIKGQPGYLNNQRKKELLIVILEFALIIAILLVGFFTTKTKLNLFTLVAILGCLPACKSLVGLIIRFPYQSIDSSKAKDIALKTPLLTVSYDMVITSHKKIMPLTCVVISNNTVCGYASNSAVDVQYLATHIKQILAQNKYEKVSVKIFNDYTAFLSRAEGMNSIVAIDRLDYVKKETEIKNIILRISL